MEVRVGSKSYQCDKFGLTELADLQDWLQERREEKIIKRARKVYEGDLPDRIFDEISKEVTLDDLEDAIASDVRSIGYLIFLTIHKKNPSVTEKEIFAEIGDLDSAMKALGDMTPTGAPKKKAAKVKA